MTLSGAGPPARLLALLAGVACGLALRPLPPRDAAPASAVRHAPPRAAPAASSPYGAPHAAAAGFRHGSPQGNGAHGRGRPHGGGWSGARALRTAPDAALCTLLTAGPAHAAGAPRLAWHQAVLRSGMEPRPGPGDPERPGVAGVAAADDVEAPWPPAGAAPGDAAPGPAAEVRGSPPGSAGPPAADPPAGAPPGAAPSAPGVPSSPAAAIVERAIDLAIARRDREAATALQPLELPAGSAAAFVRALASARGGGADAAVLADFASSPEAPLACRVPAALEAARARSRSGDAAGALRLLEDAGRHLPEVGDHVAAWSIEALAVAAAHGASASEALALAEGLHRRALDTAPTRRGALALRRADRARSALLARAGRPSDARRVLEGLLGGASRVERPALLADLAELDARLGEPARAASRLRSILDRHPESDEALALLAPPARREPPLLRPSVTDSAAVLAARGLPREAAQALTPTTDPALLARRGHVRFRAGDFHGAAADYAEAIARGGPAPALRMELAKSWARAGETARARGLYRELLDAAPSGRRAPTLTYLIADLFQEEDQADSAAAWFRRLGERWPRADLAPRGVLRLGHLEFARGRVAAAEEAYRAYLARHPDGEDRREARYWLARALAESGRGDDARRAFAELTAFPSDDWYALLARRRLGGSADELAAAVFGRGGPGPSAGGSPPAGADPAAAGFAAISPADTVVQPGAEAAALRRARALLLAGETDAAAREVNAAAGAAGGDRAALRRVARWALARGFPETTFRLGSALLAADPAAVDAAALAHAAAYPALVLHESAEQGIPRSLLWAVARRESRFDPAARSPVGATGLLQLMPATAREEAARERLPTFDPGDLRRPEPNLHLGAAHLRRLLEDAGGRWEVALAAYNAGGHAARRWTGFPESGTPEGFVERIPFRETRAYVKLVLAARARYEELHGR